MKRLMIVIAAGLLSVNVMACAGDPCAKVMDKMCAAAGEEICAEMKKEMGDKKIGDAEKKECEAILADEKKLNEMLEGIKAMAALKKGLDKAAEGEPKAEEPKAEEKKAE